ncbi:MAG: DUF4115 domain-containing protein [Thermoflexales bacterium]|nr:DUF4115 domain-containing protein [Thermoflexales bacterium]
MSEVSRTLREAREARNLTIAAAAKATCIKARYLEAMEDERWDEMPGPVQARGFLKNYAIFLGLDGGALASLREHEASNPPPVLQPQAAAWIGPPPSASRQEAAAPLEPGTSPSQELEPVAPSLPTPPPPSPLPPPAPLGQPAPLATEAQSSPQPDPMEQFGLPIWLSLDMVAAGVALVLFVIVALLAARAYLLPLVATLAAPPQATDRPMASPQAEILLTPTITPTAAFPLNPSGGIEIGLSALKEHAWVRVSTDGVTAFEGLLSPSQSLVWNAKEQLIVETGDGAALNLNVNNNAMGLLGERDQVTIRAWSPRGEVVPPPTSTPAPPTATPEPAPTLVPTPAQ